MDFGIDRNLLELPIEIQVVIGSGYLAYLVAYRGIRDHHKQIDTAFIAIVFSLVATIILAFLPSSFGIWRIVVTGFATILIGIFWRKLFSPAIEMVLHKFNISWSDETPSAWSKIAIHNNRNYLSQIDVELENGDWLFCDNTAKFKDAPFGPCVLGTSGDVAIYATHKCASGGEIVEIGDVHDPDYGYKMTYVPTSGVRRVTMRLKSA